MSQAFSVQQSNQSASVFAELLLWQIHEISDDNWGQVIGPTGTYQQNQFLDVPFKWSPGLRAGVDFNLKESRWHVLLYYTGYQTEGKRVVSTNSSEVHSAFLGNFFANNLTGAGVSGPYYKEAGMRWNVLFHTLDLELGRELIINPLMNLRPFVGLKTSVIDQSINTSWQQPFDDTTKQPITTFSSATEKVTNDFKGFGPSFGLDSYWHLYTSHENRLNLIGQFSGAFLWGHWDITDVYQNNTPVSITIQNDKMSSVAFMARGYLGLEWAHGVGQIDMSLRIGYETQAWFNQLRYYSFDMGRTENALFLHGGVLGGYLRF